MPFIHDDYLDNLAALGVLTNRRIDICHTQEPATYTEATSTYTCGNKTGLAMTAVANAAAGSGREVATPAITDGNVTSTQAVCDWWGLTDAAANLHAAGDLSAPQAVTSGNTFSLDIIKIINRDAA